MGYRRFHIDCVFVVVFVEYDLILQLLYNIIYIYTYIYMNSFNTVLYQYLETGTKDIL